MIIRLQLGIDVASHTGDAMPLPPDSACAAANDRAGAAHCTARADVCLACDARTTFADLLREAVERHSLGGRLLPFLEGGTGAGRRTLYALLYSDDDATLLRPHWSSRRGPCDGASDGEDAEAEIVRRSLRLSVGSRIMEPHGNVSDFLRERSSEGGDHGANCRGSRKRKAGEDTHVCVDMKLTATECGHGTAPSRVNVLLCEEHWRKRGKILQCKVLPGRGFDGSLANRPVDNANVIRHDALSSVLIPHFLQRNQLLTATALVVPSSLIFRGLDSLDGIQLSVDKPSYCGVRSLNLERPAVLRQYFGMDATSQLPVPTSEEAVWRSCYGMGSGSKSVGSHPR